MVKKILLSGLLLVTTSSIAFAKEIKTFGCGITKSAFLVKLNSAYTKETGIKVTIPGRGGAVKAMKLVDAEKVDAASGCRPPLKGMGIKATVVSWGAIVPIAHKSNKVNNITVDQLKGILAGKITNWKELGGDDAQIKLYIRNGKNSGVGYSARKLLFNNPNQEFAKNAKKKGSSGPIRKACAKSKYAFGIDDVKSAQKGGKLKLISLNGVTATKTNIMNGKYPLGRPHYIYTKNSSEGKKFLQFALSKKGQKAISDAGSVNLQEGKNLKAIY
jgi:phosphate transport system substrate-binding protein